MKPYCVPGTLSSEFVQFRTKIQYEMLHERPVAYLRGNEANFDLAAHGFQFLRLPEDMVRLDVRRDEKQVFIERVTALVEEFLGLPFYRYRGYILCVEFDASSPI